VFVLNALDREFEPRLGQANDNEISICCFSAKQAALIKSLTHSLNIKKYHDILPWKSRTWLDTMTYCHENPRPDLTPWHTTMEIQVPTWHHDILPWKSRSWLDTMYLYLKYNQNQWYVWYWMCLLVIESTCVLFSRKTI
jgi:hypothetical protein